jgi:hypothetical protein
MKKWEIAGISVLPVVELVLALNDLLAPGYAMGDGIVLVPETVILHVVAAVATTAAIIRGMRDSKAAE